MRVCRLHGEVSGDPCRRHSCPWCGAIVALQYAAALSQADVDRFLVLTQVGETWPRRRERMKRMTYELRRRWGPMEVAYTIEPNPAGTGHHANVLQYGPARIPKRSLSEVADSVGMGSVTWISRARSLESTSWYVVKMAAAAYSLKLSQEPEEFHSYLAANGGRLVHASRGFWRVRRDGTKVGARQARKVALAGVVGERHEWVYRLVA